jgi:hypothetical protein
MATAATAATAEEDSVAVQGDRGGKMAPATAATAATAEEVPSAHHPASDEPARGGSGTVNAARAAARLSAELALAALASGLVGAAFHVLQLFSIKNAARGVWSSTPMHNVDYARREIVIVHLEANTMSRRHREVNEVGWSWTFVILCSFPLAYAQFLGASRQVCVWMAGAVALAYVSLEVGWVVLGVRPISTYIPVVGFLWMYAALRALCPSGSLIPRQALRQLLVLVVGNFLVWNFPASRTVSTTGRLIASRRPAADASIRTWSASSLLLSCSTCTGR